MADVRWKGGAPEIAQVNTITPANVNIGNTFTITINGKNVTVTATAATVANVTALLAAACEASDYPEFGEVDWVDSTTLVTATAATPGVPFTQTSSATGGTATNTTATTTASSGPNYWSVASNWSGATVPVNSDVVYIENSDVSILYGLAQSAVTLTSLNVAASYTGAIGLAEVNRSGSSNYLEYRDQYLAISATTMNVGSGDGDGATLLKINTGSVQTTINCRLTGQGSDSTAPTFAWKGTHASSAVNLSGGNFGASVYGGEAATIATLNVSGDSTFYGGPGLTLTTLNLAGGGAVLNSGATTVVQYDGLLVIYSGAFTTLTVDGGTCTYNSTGTITTLNVGNAGVTQFANDLRTRTATNCNVYAGGSLLDDYSTVTFTNPLRVVRCGLEDVTLRLGNNRTYAISS